MRDSSKADAHLLVVRKESQAPGGADPRSPWRLAVMAQNEARIRQGQDWLSSVQHGEVWLEALLLMQEGERNRFDRDMMRADVGDLDNLIYGIISRIDKSGFAWRSLSSTSGSHGERRGYQVDGRALTEEYVGKFTRGSESVLVFACKVSERRSLINEVSEYVRASMKKGLGLSLLRQSLLERNDNLNARKIPVELLWRPDASPRLLLPAQAPRTLLHVDRQSPVDMAPSTRSGPELGRQDRLVERLQVGETVYPLHSPLKCRFLPLAEGGPRLEALGSHFVGHGAGFEEAFDDFQLSVHVAFQDLLDKKPSAMTDEDRERWSELEQAIDVQAYRDRLPIVFTQTGRVTQVTTGPAIVTWWPSNQVEEVDLRRYPAEFARFAVGQWFEAVVERERRGRKLRRVRHMSPISPIEPMTCDRANALWESFAPSTQLPRSPRDWTVSSSRGSDKTPSKGLLPWVTGDLVGDSQTDQRESGGLQ